MRLLVLLAAIAIALLMALALTPRLVQSQTDPLCVVVQGFVVDEGRKPVVAFVCDNEGRTFRFVSNSFYKRFMDADEPLVLRKGEIR